MKKQDSYYVGINESTRIRKDLLLCSKSVIDVLKRISLFKELKQRKIEKLQELRQVTDSLIVLNKKIRSKLPEKPEIPKEVKKRVKEEKISYDVAYLEEELEKIENRLKDLE